jgi:hypothetical protein
MFSKMRQHRYRMTKCSAGSCYNICVGTTLVNRKSFALVFYIYVFLVLKNFWLADFGMCVVLCLTIVKSFAL